MLDVVSVLEELGAATPFELAGQTDSAGLRLRELGERLDDLVTGERFAFHACLIIAPDGGDSESTEDQPQQDDDGNDGDDNSGDVRTV